ncbi:MAG: Na+-transporting NADH:ubiquinone oxidoreductase subunit NqrB [Gammaproteobacteria bacterium]|jgi:Na+-transporting NADH:ubiquinone oxidoreductase subunit NqrB
MQEGWNWRDPRIFQISALLMLIVVGISALDFLIQPAIALTIIVVALGLHRGLTNSWNGSASALISALSRCLLLRTDSLLIAAAGVAIAGKQLVQLRGRHLFNPNAPP